MTQSTDRLFIWHYGYVDIYPVAEIERIAAIISSILGIAVVALPAGIITAGYINKLKNTKFI